MCSVIAVDLGFIRYKTSKNCVSSTKRYKLCFVLLFITGFRCNLVLTFCQLEGMLSIRYYFGTVVPGARSIVTKFSIQIDYSWNFVVVTRTRVDRPVLVLPRYIVQYEI